MPSNQQEVFIKTKNDQGDLVQKTVDGLEPLNGVNVNEIPQLDKQNVFEKQAQFDNGLDMRGDMVDDSNTLYRTSDKVFEQPAAGQNNTVVVTGDPSTRATRATAVDNAIGKAGNEDKDFVLVPHEFGPGTDGYDASAVNFTKNGFAGRLIAEGQNHAYYNPVAYGFDVKPFSDTSDDPKPTDPFDVILDQMEDSGGTIKCPPGRYQFDSEIQPPTISTDDNIIKPFRLLGSNPSSISGGTTTWSRLQVLFDFRSSTGFNFEANAVSRSRWQGSIENIHVRGQGNPGQNGIVLGDCQSHELNNVAVKGFERNIRVFGKTYYGSWEQVRCFNALKEGAQFVIDALTNGFGITNSQFSANGKSGIDFQAKVGEVSLKNVWMESNGAYGCEYLSPETITVINCHTEGNGSAGYLLEQGGTINVVGGKNTPDNGRELIHARGKDKNGNGVVVILDGHTTRAKNNPASVIDQNDPSDVDHVIVDGAKYVDRNTTGNTVQLMRFALGKGTKTITTRGSNLATQQSELGQPNNDWHASPATGPKEVLKTIDFGSITSQSSNQQTVTITGAAAGMPVRVSPVDGLEAGITLDAWVSAADTVTVQATNVTSGSVDPASREYNLVVGRR